MIQGTESGEKVIIQNIAGEWKPIRGEQKNENGQILKGGPLDGVNINDLPDGTIVYVGGAQRAEPTNYNNQEVNETTGSANDTGGEALDMAGYPEFDGIIHFSPSDFFCKCADPNCEGKKRVHMKHEVLAVAERVYEHFGSVIVTSGIRCAKHNAAQPGSVPNSRHLSGRAIDFVVRGFSAGDLLSYVQRQKEIRYAYAIDATAVHMDVN